MGQENIGHEIEEHIDSEIEKHRETEEHIDHEIEEQLTEQLVFLYEKWRSCSRGVGTEDDKIEVFFQAINGRIEKGFSILKEPGMYEDEKEMEKLLGKLYRNWKNYMKDCLGDDTTVNIFIEIAKSMLYVTMKKGDKSWKDENGRKVG